MEGFKTVLVGSTNVGKSCIIHRILGNEFDSTCEPTVGAVTKNYNNPLLSKKDLILTDTAGQEKFKSLVPLYFRGAAAAIIVYSIDIRESLNDVEETWKNFIEDYQIKIVYLVENKVDLRNDEDYENKDELLSEEDGRKLADKLGYQFMSVSAKTGHNIKTLADEVLINCVNSNENKPKPFPIPEPIEQDHKKDDTFFGNLLKKC